MNFVHKNLFSLIFFQICYPEFQRLRGLEVSSIVLLGHPLLHISLSCFYQGSIGIYHGLLNIYIFRSPWIYTRYYSSSASKILKIRLIYGILIRNCASGFIKTILYIIKLLIHFLFITMVVIVNLNLLIPLCLLLFYPGSYWLH